MGFKVIEGILMIKFESFLHDVNKFKVKLVRGLNLEYFTSLLDSINGISSLYSNLKGYSSYHSFIPLDKVNHL